MKIVLLVGYVLLLCGMVILILKCTDVCNIERLNCFKDDLMNKDSENIHADLTKLKSLYNGQLIMDDLVQQFGAHPDYKTLKSCATTCEHNNTAKWTGTGCECNNKGQYIIENGYVVCKDQPSPDDNTHKLSGTEFEWRNKGGTRPYIKDKNSDKMIYIDSNPTQLCDNDEVIEIANSRYADTCILDKSGAEIQFSNDDKSKAHKDILTASDCTAMMKKLYDGQQNIKAPYKKKTKDGLETLMKVCGTNSTFDPCKTWNSATRSNSASIEITYKCVKK